MDALLTIFDTSDFPARWNCGRWSELHGWVHITADIITGLSYFAIPLVLAYFVWNRKDVPFSRLFWLFGIFILSCGSVHFVEASIFWHPMYRLSAVLKVVTAMVSALTVVALFRNVPQALKLPGLADINDKLQHEVRLRKRANKDLALKNRELEEFAHIASHDLQEPLRVIAAFGDLLKKDLGDELSDRVSDDIKHMTSSVHRMQHLVTDILALSRTGNDALVRAQVALDDCLTEACDMLAASIVEQQVELRKTDLPTLLVDKRLVTQLFQNLIGNAIKFHHPDRLPVIEITNEGDRIFGVKDNGIGIAKEYAENVFVPFKRLHGRSTFEGTGIGLAICRKAVERHGGRIWIEAESAEGTHVKFTLSAKENAE